ncbi:hypothetical protein T08_2367 [Trichinella sp. T8]|uniref:Uncharacterized protein n=1 Tax=Trichinella murrelli TaxID=144512 RepID=A0A0V0TQT0_9BILA|nr:hypothetical protein T05_7832 [Trichinella murrelli]KRZ84904.1 hypothetical protein T08_2367 [Trichinella sp. T8]
MFVFGLARKYSTLKKNREAERRRSWLPLSSSEYKRIANMRFYWRRARRLPIFPPPPGRSVYYCLLPSLFGTFSFENARVCDSTQHNGSTCCPLSIKQCQSLQCIVSFHVVPKGRLNGAQPEKWSPSIAIHIASGKAPSLLFS